jgi:hypothetical protein
MVVMIINVVFFAVSIYYIQNLYSMKCECSYSVLLLVYLIYSILKLAWILFALMFFVIVWLFVRNRIG